MSIPKPSAPTKQWKTFALAYSAPRVPISAWGGVTIRSARARVFASVPHSPVISLSLLSVCSPPEPRLQARNGDSPEARPTERRLQQRTPLGP
jgi:hypothetical protein